MRGKLRSIGLLLVVLLGGWFVPGLAWAASVKSVQSGTVTMSTATQTATITAVDTTKAFVVCQNRTNSSNASNRATCTLSSTAVTVTGGAANAGEVVSWYVVEFEGGVSVQRGAASFVTTGTLVNVTLPTAVDLTKSFVLISETTTSTSQVIDEEWTTRAQLTTTTNLELSRNESGIAVTVQWQVVQMEGASVQRGLTTIGAGAATATATISSVNTATSFLVMSRRGAAATNGIESQYQVRGAITGATTLTFTRVSTTNTVDIAWEVISLSDGSSVQAGTTSTAATGNATLNQAISAIDTARSVPFVSASGGAGTQTANLDETSWTAAFTTTTNLQFQRAGTGTNGSIAWFVVQFFKCAAVSDVDYVAVTAQNGQAIVYWSSANPVVVLQKPTTAFLTSELPVNGAISTVSSAIGGATVIYDGASAAAGVTCTATSCTQTGLTNGVTYYYKVIAKTGTAGATCYAPGTVNTSGGVSAAPTLGPSPAWSYVLAGGSILKGGTAGIGTIYTSSNVSRIISLNTANGTQTWAPVAANAPIQGWLTWLPGSGVRSVQSGSVTMAGTTQTVTINPVDTSKAFVVCSHRTGSSNASQRVTCELSASAVTITAGEAGAVVQWYVAEFSNGVTVRRGTTTFALTDATLNVPLVAFDLTKSFVLISERTSSTSQLVDEQWTTRARLTSPTNLELSRNATGIDLTVAWQVVQMGAASVQRGLLTMLVGETSKTQAITAVTPGSSFLLLTRRAAATTGGVESEYQVRGELTNATTLTFTRSTASTSLDIAWEVVSLSDGTSVQRGIVSTVAATDEILNATLSAINTTRTVPFISVSGGPGPTNTADLDSTSYTAAFTSTTNLQLQRTSSLDAQAQVAWQVLQFPQPASEAVIGGDQGTGAPDTGRVYSVDTVSGALNWQVTLTGADAVQAPVSAQVRSLSNAAFNAAYASDVIYAATRNTSTTNNKVFALNASTGAVLWTFNGTGAFLMDYVAGQPWVDYTRNRLYVASHAGATGTQPSLWVINTLDGSLVQSFSSLGDIDTSPTLSSDGSTLYVGNTAGNLYAVNVATLALKWPSPVALGTAIVGLVWEDGATVGRLYFATADGNVRCMQDTGAGASACWAAPTVVLGPSTPLVLDRLYVGSWNGVLGQLYQIRLSDGFVEKLVTVGDGTKQPGDVSTETGGEIFVGTGDPAGGKLYRFPAPLP